MIRLFALLLTSCLSLAACEKAVSVTHDDWLGRWTGPEGTYLELAKNEKNYLVSIQSLDGLETYEGHPDKSGIVFERMGVRETIYAGNGQETGMKWLLDKQNCLIIKTGEGFCR